MKHPKALLGVFALLVIATLVIAQTQAGPIWSPSIIVQTTQTNTAAAAMILDMSAATGANAFKVPVIAGATSGANGTIDYDSTNGNTHVRTNGADSIAASEAAALAAGTIPKATDATHGLLTASSMVDNATFINTAEPITSGTAGGAPNVNKSDYAILASDMGTISSATLVPITNMTWTIAASKNYALDCEIFLTAATTGTAAFGLVGPGTPTSYTLSVDGNVGAASAYNSGQINAGAAWTSTATPATGAFATSAHVHVRAGIQNGSTGGTLTLDYSNPAAGGTLKANANSWCRLTGVN